MRNRDLAIKEVVGDPFYLFYQIFENNHYIDPEWNFHYFPFTDYIPRGSVPRNRLRGKQIRLRTDSAFFFKSNKSRLEKFLSYSPSAILKLGFLNQVKYRAGRKVDPELDVLDITEMKEQIQFFSIFFAEDVERLQDKYQESDTVEDFIIWILDNAYNFYPYTLFWFYKYGFNKIYPPAEVSNEFKVELKRAKLFLQFNALLNEDISSTAKMIMKDFVWIR